MIFKDRIEAGNLLAAKLESYKTENAIIMAIPRGGVPIGYQVAEKLHLPLEVVLSKKIGHPLHKEFAIGAVTLKHKVLSDAASVVPSEYIEAETKKIRTLLTKRYQEYYGKKKPLQLKDKVLIVVDDGIATGNTILSTIEMLYDEKPKQIIVAIPVSSQNALQKLKNTPFIDDVICLKAPVNFRAVGQFYKNFDQVDDTEVKALLNKETVA
ncbi:MAG: phosphoribosyltransferase family protein [Algibacter sp.]|uniref:phosphoribosyltransferase n=1 Tax=Algibacter sp. TaxID=1872428 RepID=UPI00260CC2D2|nr:phosphoribosyltransferase family protein [Algibacter sp.]MDG1729477.1 phosphoribosyltransferase family protein [Algibacter sp.]MDG2178663.1 phosphoribosyltransferase family protein [Algibacter sp.]